MIPYIGSSGMVLRQNPVDVIMRRWDGIGSEKMVLGLG